MEFFAKNAKFLRSKDNMTQQKIRNKLEIEPTTWSNYERGKSSPNLKLFCKISNFFKVSETDLLHTDLSLADPEVLRDKYFLHHDPDAAQEASEAVLTMKNGIIKLLEDQIKVLEDSLADKDKIIAYLESDIIRLKRS